MVTICSGVSEIGCARFSIVGGGNEDVSAEAAAILPAIGLVDLSSASACQFLKRADDLEAHLLEIPEMPFAAFDAQVFDRSQQVEPHVRAIAHANVVNTSQKSFTNNQL